MTQIMELSEKLKIAVAENVELESRKEELLEDMRKVMQNNYRNILFDELKLYYDMAKTFRDKYRGCEAYYTDNCEDKLKLKFYHSEIVEATLKIPTEEGSNYYFGLHGDDTENMYIRRMGEKEVKYYSSYFDTEEHTLQLLERIRKGYASIFTQFLDFIDKENKELIKTVEDLSKRLADYSTVENKEDGTVEIHLGGKLFRGSIVEQ